MKLIETLKNKKQPSSPPIWLMRQAGRYLPEYMAVRAEAGDFMTMCFTPDYATTVTLQPIERFDFDAAIIFSDILVIPYALGQEVGFVKGEGPKLGALDIDKLNFNMDRLSAVFEALRKTRAALAPEKALIGFAGSPWTVACYMVHGQGSKDWDKARLMAYKQPERFQKLITILIEATSQYLIEKVNAGANALQLFDSWSGVLSEQQFQRWVITPTKIIIDKVKKIHPNIPIIGFPRGAGIKVKNYALETGIDALGLDQMTPLSFAKDLQNICPVQGNLDPMALLAGGDVLQSETEKILKSLSDHPFIFNLGHGIIKETPPEHIQQLVDIVRGYNG